MTKVGNLVKRAVDDIRMIFGFDNRGQPAAAVYDESDESFIRRQAEDFVGGAKEEGNGAGISRRVFRKAYIGEAGERDDIGMPISERCLRRLERLKERQDLLARAFAEKKKNGWTARLSVEGKERSVGARAGDEGCALADGDML